MNYFDIDVEWNAYNHVTAQCRQYPEPDNKCFGHTVPQVLNKLITFISNGKETSCTLTVYFNSSGYKKTYKDTVYIESDYEIVGDELWDFYQQKDCDIITFNITLSTVKKVDSSFSETGKYGLFLGAPLDNEKLDNLEKAILSDYKIPREYLGLPCKDDKEEELLHGKTRKYALPTENNHINLHIIQKLDKVLSMYFDQILLDLKQIEASFVISEKGDIIQQLSVEKEKI